MEILFFILIWILIILVLGFIIINIVSRRKNKKVKTKIDKLSNDDKLLAIDELRKICKDNPENYTAREKLAELLVDVKSYVLAIKEYTLLIDSAIVHKELSELKYLVKTAETYIKLENFSDAKKYFFLAKKIDDLNFEANLNLGKIELKNKNFEKSLLFLNIALRLFPEDMDVQKSLGICFYNLSRYTEAKDCFLKVLQNDQEEVEVLYYLAYTLANLSRNDDAIKYFLKLEKIPKYSVESILAIANIHKKMKMYIQSIEEYEKVLSGNFLKGDKHLEVLYNLGECYVNIHNLAKAIQVWQKLSAINSDYKDIKVKLENYSQLNSNSMLERYLLGSVNQFTNICKIFIKFYVPKYANLKGNIKFLNTRLNKDNTLEIYVEVSNGNFIDQLYFNFMRSTTTVGDLILRNLYNELKQEKIDRGICVTAGSFSATAKHFVESRMIELVERNQLIDILQKISVLLKNN